MALDHKQSKYFHQAPTITLHKFIEVNCILKHSCVVILKTITSISQEFPKNVLERVQKVAATVINGGREKEH